MHNMLVEWNSDAAAMSLQRSNALSAMNADLRGEFDAIEQMIDRQAEGLVGFYHRLGEQLARIDGNHKKYGSGAVGLIADALHIGSNTVYRAISFFRWKPQKEDVDALRALRGPNDMRLEWSHFIALLDTKEDQREPLLEKILKHGWSVRELRKAMEQLSLPTKTPTSPSTSRGLAANLKRIGTMATDFAERLAGPFDRGILQPLTEINSAVASEVLEQINDVRQNFEDVAAKATKRAEALAALHKTLSSASDAQAADPANEPDSKAGKIADARTTRKERRPSLA
jgi:hypothetical protein